MDLRRFGLSHSAFAHFIFHIYLRSYIFCCWLWLPFPSWSSFHRQSLCFRPRGVGEVWATALIQNVRFEGQSRKSSLCYTPSEWLDKISPRTERALIVWITNFWVEPVNGRRFDPHSSTSLWGPAGQKQIWFVQFRSRFHFYFYASKRDVCSCNCENHSWWFVCVEGIGPIPRRLPLLLNATLVCSSLTFTERKKSIKLI
jgi:hypothetical protein